MVSDIVNRQDLENYARGYFHSDDDLGEFELHRLNGSWELAKSDGSLGYIFVILPQSYIEGMNHVNHLAEQLNDCGKIIFHSQADYQHGRVAMMWRRKNG